MFQLNDSYIGKCFYILSYLGKYVFTSSTSISAVAVARYLTTGTNEKELLLLNDQIYIPVFRNPVLRSGNYLALAPAQFVYPLLAHNDTLNLIKL